MFVPRWKTLLNDVTSAGIEEIAVIISAGCGREYRTAAGKHADRLNFL